MLRGQLPQQMLKLCQPVAALNAGRDSQELLVSQNIVDERGEVAARSDFDEQSHTVGVHRANDVIWQSSFLLVPLYTGFGGMLGEPYSLSTTGFDVDRLSTNRSVRPDWDVRWKVGLRTVGIGFYGIPYPVAMSGRLANRSPSGPTATLVSDAAPSATPSIAPTTAGGAPRTVVR